VRTTKQYQVWRRRTIDRAISILGLIRITRAGKDGELHSPARVCPECRKELDVVVLPERVCATCWSQNVIAAWRVPPVDLRVVPNGRR
jgi:ribosomal protein L32